MERGTITISRTSVTITGHVWMADYEIAELFGVTLSAVNSNIKAIYKCRPMHESDTYQYLHLANGNRADGYNMEMITALAFRLNSLPAKIFRGWIIKKAVTPIRSEPPIVLQFKEGFQC